MTSLEDHAATADGPEIVVSSDLPQRPAARILSSDLVAADELTDEGQFPEFGQFLQVETVEEGEEEWWECPSTLAAVVVEIVSEQEQGLESSVLSVHSAAKTPSGEWRWVVDVDPAED